MTGPIYLVSACASGEEFVAAFRRYADKNGLFVPLGEPLAVGARGRFAVTLKDGGVMLEGEAEVITSARTPSVLHGRIGMTLRFLEPDEPSKTLLGELAMARLAMRPQPPSVAPRPTEIPAEPRPVPPPPAGRVDAVNALAECVVIGDASVLPAAGAPAVAATKPSAKFAIPAVPTLPPGARKTGPATGSLPPMKPAVSRTSTSQSANPPPPAGGSLAQVPAPAPAPPPSPMPASTPSTMPSTMPAMTPPAEVEPPAVTPRATPLPDQLRPAVEAARPEPARPEPARPVTGLSKTMAAVPLLPGPSSDTYIAAVPPPPPEVAWTVTPTSVTVPPTRPETGGERERIISTTLTAVPLAASALQSSPTDIGGVIVDPDATPVETSPEEDVSSRTQVHAGAPRPPAKLSDEIDLAKTLNSPPPDMAEIRAEIDRRTAAARARSQSEAQLGAQRPSTPEVEISEPTDLTDLPIGPPLSVVVESPHSPEAVMARAPRKTVIGVAVVPSSGPVRLPAPRAPSPEPGTDPSIEASAEALIEASAEASAELNDAGDPSASDSNAPFIESLESPAKSRNISVPPTGEVAYDPSIGTPIEISLDVSLDLAADDPALGDEPTGVAERIVVGDAAVDGTAPTLPPDGRMSPFARTRKDSEQNWSMPVERLSGTTPTPTPTPGPARAAESGKPISKIPTAESAPVRKPGDWVMSSEKLANRVVGQVPGAGPSAAPSPGATPSPASVTATGHASGPLPGVAPAPLSAIAPLPLPTPAAAPGPARAEPGGPPVRPSRTKMPSKGDWLISIDPQAPDGWSEPLAPKIEEVEAGNDLPSVASAEPLDSTPKGPSPTPSDLRPAEPKVQIDPTLIEPLRAMPADAPLRPMPPDAPFQHAPMAEPVFSSAASSSELPSLAMSMAPANVTPAPQPLPYVPHMHAHASHTSMVAQAPAYPMDPSYQMIPVSSVAMPRAATAGGSGVESYGGISDSYGGDVARPVAGRRRRMIIIVITAIIAVGIGAFALTRLSHPSTEPAPATPAPAATPAKPTKTSSLPPGAMPHPDTATSFTAAAPVADEPATPPAPPVAAVVTRPAASGCFASVASQPAGAEVVLDQAVLGTTPGKIELPCGHAVELTIRKGHLVPAIRSVTATPDGAPVRVALAKQTFQVKISSMPAGAVVSLDGTALGTTPTTIKLTAFEAATLSIAKDGYTTTTESVTPKANGVAVHASLKKQKH